MFVYCNWLLSKYNRNDVTRSSGLVMISKSLVMKSGEVILLMIGFLEYKRVKVSFLSHFNN